MCYQVLKLISVFFITFLPKTIFFPIFLVMTKGNDNKILLSQIGYCHFYILFLFLGYVIKKSKFSNYVSKHISYL